MWILLTIALGAGVGRRNILSHHKIDEKDYWVTRPLRTRSHLSILAFRKRLRRKAREQQHHSKQFLSMENKIWELFPVADLTDLQ
jgi:hypothetical protein